MTPAAILAFALTISPGSVVGASSQGNAAGMRHPAASSTTAATTPPTVAAVVSHGCGDSRLHLNLTINTRVEFGGDIGNQPPMKIGGQPAMVPLPSIPGTSVTWQVRMFGDIHPFAEGVHQVPPCISDIGPAPQIGDAVRLERRRAAVWSWVVQRVRGAW